MTDGEREGESDGGGEGERARRHSAFVTASPRSVVASAASAISTHEVVTSTASAISTHGIGASAISTHEIAEATLEGGCDAGLESRREEPSEHDEVHCDICPRQGDASIDAHREVATEGGQD